MRVLLVPILLTLIAVGMGFIGYFLYDQAWGPEAHLRAARKALLRRDFAEARAQVQLVLRLRPKTAEAHLIAAQIARRAVDPILSAGPAETTSTLPFAPHREFGSYESAARHLQEYRRLGGLAEVVRLEQFLASAQRGDLAQVEAALRGVLDRDYPDPVPIWEALAKGYLATYRLAEAEQHLSQWLEKQEDAQALFWRAWVWERFRNTPRALADYRRAAELVPDNEAVRLQLAWVLLAGTQPNEAAEQFTWLRLRRPEDPAVLLGLARCRLEMGDSDEARQLLDTVLAAHPRNVAALTERGRLALKEKRLEPAEAFLRQAEVLAPFDYQVRYALGLCLQQAGKRDEARICLGKANQIETDMKQMAGVMRRINTKPHDPAPRLEAGKILMRNGLENEGLRWLESALQQDGNHAPTHRAFAEYFERIGNKTEAAQHRRLASNSQ